MTNVSDNLSKMIFEGYLKLDDFEGRVSVGSSNGSTILRAEEKINLALFIHKIFGKDGDWAMSILDNKKMINYDSENGYFIAVDLLFDEMA